MIWKMKLVSQIYDEKFLLVMPDMIFIFFGFFWYEICWNFVNDDKFLGWETHEWELNVTKLLENHISWWVTVSNNIENFS